MKIGIDIGGSHVGLGLVDENGKIVKKVEQDITNLNNVEQYILSFIEDNIKEIIANINNEQNNENDTTITNIGIAVPGNYKGMEALNLVNLGLDKIDFSRIKEKFNIPVKLINDAKASAIAEKKYGALKNYKDSVFICLGTGIGGAVFLNNELLISNRNPGFELGHMIIQKDGIQCNCGKKGCFETYCSMKRFKNKIACELEKTYGKKIKSSKNILELLKKYLENVESVDISNLKEDKMLNIIDEYIDNLVVGLSNITDIFEPEAICFGGSFVYFEDILYKRLVNEFNKRNYVFNKGNLPKLVLAKLENDTGIVGSALL